METSRTYICRGVPELGYHFGGPHSKDYSIFWVYIGIPLFSETTMYICIYTHIHTHVYVMFMCISVVYPMRPHGEQQSGNKSQRPDSRFRVSVLGLAWTVGLHELGFGAMTPRP